MNRLLLTKIRIPKPFHLNSIIKLTPYLQPSSSSRLKFSSHTSSATNQTTISDSSTNIEDTSTTDDVTTEELKRRIDRYLGGDVEAIPSIFEAILARKLSGKHEDTDDELMEEFRSKTGQVEDQLPLSDDDSDEDLTDSDEDFSD